MINARDYSVNSRRLMLAACLLGAGVLSSGPANAFGQVTGSGTANKVPKWTGAAALGDSVMSESAGGISVAGDLSVRKTFPVLYLFDTFGATDARQFYFFNGGGNILGRWVNDANTTVLTETITFKNNGNVGIGNNNPLTLLHTKTGDVVNTLAIDSGGATTANLSELSLFDRGGAKWALRKTVDNQFGVYDSAAGLYRFYVRDTGNIGIGTTSPSAKLHVVGDVTLTGSGNITNAGNITATGTISGGVIIAKYQDVAEWVPAVISMPPGTVVVLDPERSNHVVSSSQAYDTRVAGVVSGKPGVILGEGGDGKVMVATTGRVRVKVDATISPIRVGDLLVTSGKEGVAMRSQPIDLAGTPIHRPGTLIGKALEPLDKGAGEILVLLSLQ